VALAGIVLTIVKLLLDNNARASALKAAEAARNAAEAARRAAEQQAAMRKKEEEQREKEEEKNQTEKKVRKKLKRSSKVLQVLAVVFFVLAAIIWCSMLGASLAGQWSSAAEDVGVAAFFSLFGAGMSVGSAFLRRREQDMARYIAMIGERESISLAKLSDATTYRISRVKRDLQAMIDEGLFGDSAYIDAANLCFMRHPDAVPDGVAEAFGSVSRRSMSGTAEDIGASQETDGGETASAEAEADIGVEDYDALLKKIRALDVAIQDEAVSERSCRIERITRHIFEYITLRPDKKEQIRMFLSYYLPTTLKLLESYSRIERVGAAGQNMREAKANIEKTLDTLVAGFEQQLDQLYGAESVDISSDIEVLEQMMKRDGLKENTDFSSDPGYTDDISDELGSGAAYQRRS